MSVENLTGLLLGQYELRELMGTGGMGSVYRAYQASLKREVAVKIMSPALAAQPDYLGRFNREAQTAAALEHPHIVPIHDYGTTEDGISYVVMRLLTGGSLSQRLDEATTGKRPLPSFQEIANLLKQLGSALDYAHERGVIHRDIKPNNVMFDESGSAYLVDFGIAKLVAEASSKTSATLTGTGAMVGTPAYMAPEQWLGQELTPAADQYGLGIMVYSMIVGRLPFEAPTLYALINQHLHDAPTPPQQWRTDVPDRVTVVISRALAKSPEARFPTVMTFAEAFDDAIGGVASTPTVFFTLPPAFNTLQMTPSGSFRLPAVTKPSTPIYKHPIVWALGVVILVLFGIIAAVLSPSSARDAALQQTQVALESTGTAIASSSGGRPLLAEADVTATVAWCEATLLPQYPATDEGQIAFYSDRDGNYELYLMNANGSGVRRLTENSVEESVAPTWSPDGRQAAVVSQGDGNKEIYLVDIESGEISRLTNDAAEDNRPAWSPDGSRIAFQSRRDGNWNIYSTFASV